MMKIVSHKARGWQKGTVWARLLLLSATGLSIGMGILSPLAAGCETTDSPADAAAHRGTDSAKDVENCADAQAGESRDRREPLKPLRVSRNGRYLVDTSGTPFFWAGDCAWALHTRASFHASVPGTAGQNEVDYYLSTRAAQGYTVIHTWLIPGWQVENTNGDRPLGSRLDQDTTVVLDEAFFTNVNKIIERAAHYRLYIAIELGHVLRQNADDLWHPGGLPHLEITGFAGPMGDILKAKRPPRLPRYERL